jgi:hypothetical protein
LRHLQLREKHTSLPPQPSACGKRNGTFEKGKKKKNSPDGASRFRLRWHFSKTHVPDEQNIYRKLKGEATKESTVGDIIQNAVFWSFQVRTLGSIALMREDFRRPDEPNSP